jgi:hypothetical protein
MHEGLSHKRIAGRAVPAPHSGFIFPRQPERGKKETRKASRPGAIRQSPEEELVVRRFLL